MDIMFKILIFIIIFFVSGCIGKEGETQLHVPASVLESGAEKFEYDMLGHPVIETELDSAYTCKLIFDTGSAGMLILNKDFAERIGLITRFFHGEESYCSWM